MKRFGGILLATVLLCSCSMPKNMDDMKKTTQDMKKVTDKMAKLTEHIEKRTEDIFQGSREVVSVERQNISIDDVLNSDGFGKRLKRSMVYFLSMEYQHWTGNYKDDLKEREQLMAEAVDNFFSDIDDLIDDKMPVSTPIIPSFVPYFGRAQRNWENLSILSLTMSKVHSKQEEYAKAHALKVYSMYSMITEGLAMEPKYNNGEKVPKWAESVIEHEHEAVYLLQLRHNFYPFLIASKITNIEDGFLKKIRHFFKSWYVKESYLNKKQLETLNLYLDLASETQKYLTDNLGIDLEINPYMTEMFSLLHWIVPSDERHKKFMDQLGMDMDKNEFKTFMAKLDFAPKTEDPFEQMILKLQKLTGASLYLTTQKRRDAAAAKREKQRQDVEAELWCCGA